MFENHLTTPEAIQKHIRGCWNHYKECVSEYGMDKRVAMDQAYGTSQGIISVMTQDAYNAVYTDEFRAEWEEWRKEMLAL